MPNLLKVAYPAEFWTVALALGCAFFETRKDVPRQLADLLAFLLLVRLLLLVVLRVDGQGRCGGHEGDREDQYSSSQI